MRSKVYVVTFRAAWAARLTTKLDALGAGICWAVLTRLDGLDLPALQQGGGLVVIGPDVARDPGFAARAKALPELEGVSYAVFGPVPAGLSPGLRLAMRDLSVVGDDADKAGLALLRLVGASALGRDVLGSASKEAAAALARASNDAAHAPSERRTRRLPSKAALVAIGASTGGVDALRDLLAELTAADMPPVVIVQHTRNSEGSSLVQVLGRCGPRPVRAAQTNDVLRPGHIYVACGAQHVHVVRRGPQTLARCADGAPIGGHLPAIDATFGSMRALGGDGVGVLLTGMGRDGADGLKAMHRAGAFAITQSEDSCLVYGMPRAAEELGASDLQLEPRAIGRVLSELKALS